MKLKAKEGVRSVSVGGKEYTADKKGFVDIPDEFVPTVLNAGFVVPEGDADAAAPAPAPAPATAPAPAASGSNDTASGSSGTGSLA